jgi:hypothetical protein
MALHLFTDDTDTVVAENPLDAWDVWFEFMGVITEERKYYMDPADGDPELRWVQVPDDVELEIWCDADGTPSEVGGDGCAPVKRTARAWATEYERGFLCSTEA